MFEIVTPKPSFTPITITINTKQELADVLGALTAYGKGVQKAKKSIREFGLADAYSGNARKTVRSFVNALAKAAGLPAVSWPYGHSTVNSNVAVASQR